MGHHIDWGICTLPDVSLVVQSSCISFSDIWIELSLSPCVTSVSSWGMAARFDYFLEKKNECDIVIHGAIAQ